MNLHCTIIKFALTPPTAPGQQPDSSTKGSTSQFSSSPISPQSSPQSSPFSSATVASWDPFCISTSQGSSINKLQACSRSSSFTCTGVSNVCELVRRCSKHVEWRSLFRTGFSANVLDKFSSLFFAVLDRAGLACHASSLISSLISSFDSVFSTCKSAKVCQSLPECSNCQTL